MFESLGEKLNNAFKKFRNKGKLTEADVKAGMREIKLALLEADVNFKVVRDFIKIVSERAVGAEVLESLLPAQQIVKIVNEELTRLMGGSQSKLTIASQPPTVIMMVGLQGAGKTTHAGKLAGLYKKQGKRPLLVACDVYRPAAIKQLQVVGEKLDIPVFTLGDKISPVEIAKEGVKHAKLKGYDMVFIDTAGRLQIDEVLMEELKQIKAEVNPAEILLTVDAMIGQESVNVAETFNDLLDITGVILTKLDGDTRGGAALSIRYVTGKPIKFVGTGEKLDTIEPFHPDRMASRILGMGDVLTLIDKAQAAFDEKQAAELEQKMRQQTFTLDDYLAQLQQIKGMGNLEQLMGMMPGVKPGALKDAKIDESAMAHTEAIIRSMTRRERERPEIINASRKKRIAQGSGTSVEEVNKLLRQFEQMLKMMKQFSDMGKTKKGKKMLGRMKMPF
ncbi:MAG: signal recognition particle protein [Clostridia bacterium]|nr:signal recognition particle protein [Clostridia bacterium]MBQ2248535.1 signal recognition particle protein [Clostridia bacterium]MBQ5613305.1 signal recognition particle protein [Clostridia bacterium]